MGVVVDSHWSRRSNDYLNPAAVPVRPFDDIEYDIMQLDRQPSPRDWSRHSVSSSPVLYQESDGLYYYCRNNNMLVESAQHRSSLGDCYMNGSSSNLQSTNSIHSYSSSELLQRRNRLHRSSGTHSPYDLARQQHHSPLPQMSQQQQMRPSPLLTNIKRITSYRRGRGANASFTVGSLDRDRSSGLISWVNEQEEVVRRRHSFDVNEQQHSPSFSSASASGENLHHSYAQLQDRRGVEQSSLTQGRNSYPTATVRTHSPAANSACYRRDRFGSNTSNSIMILPTSDLAPDWFDDDEKICLGDGGVIKQDNNRYNRQSGDARWSPLITTTALSCNQPSSASTCIRHISETATRAAVSDIDSLGSKYTPLAYSRRSTLPAISTGNKRSSALHIPHGGAVINVPRGRAVEAIGGNFATHQDNVWRPF